jgi:hypothetical protein
VNYWDGQGGEETQLWTKEVRGKVLAV